MIIRSPADIPQTRQQIFRSTYSKFYHQYSCILGNEVHEKNRQYFASTEIAEFAGFRPCRLCSVTKHVKKTKVAPNLLSPLPENNRS